MNGAMIGTLLIGSFPTAPIESALAIGARPSLPGHGPPVVTIAAMKLGPPKVSSISEAGADPDQPDLGLHGSRQDRHRRFLSALPHPDREPSDRVL
jgi:hypothetical protein